MKKKSTGNPPTGNLLKRGLLVTFEGGEGAGKTTQIKKLKAWLDSRGIRCVVTRQPGGTVIGEKIRSILLSPELANLSPRAEVLLYAADRAQHVDELVLPALHRGEVVLSDRFSESSVVYQGICRKLGVKRIEGLNQFATARLTPDIVLVLDVPQAEGARRMSSRGTLDRLEREKKSFHENVRRGFLKVARNNRRFAVVDGTRDPEQVFEQVKKIVEMRLKRKKLWK